MNDHERQLKLLRELSIRVAQRERGGSWLNYSPLVGLCAAVALMAHQIAGGEIVTGHINGCTHFWNRLPDGTEIDLTGCQFGGDGWHPLKRGRKVARPATVDPRHLGFAAAVLDELQRA